jgi:hypothetical protein
MSRICIPIPSSTVIGVSSTPITTPSSNVFRVEPTITGLTGGTATDLNAIVTGSGSTYPTNICVFLPAISPPAIYQLVAGTNAANSPFVIRPQDYATTTNEKVWIQRS